MLGSSLSEKSTTVVTSFLTTHETAHSSFRSLTTRLVPARYSVADYSGIQSWLRRGRGFPAEHHFFGPQTRIPVIAQAVCEIAGALISFEGGAGLAGLDGHKKAGEKHVRLFVANIVEAWLEAWYNRADIGQRREGWRNWEVLATQGDRKVAAKAKSEEEVQE